ncbi:MAG: hypothetical protein LBJ96_03670 [Holosporaceae bacterium]|jgi:hypothetical protein|nr:hypothetical protein [Holosporaceae bacterium]
MKKLVITATAVLFGSSLFAMKTSREKLDDYVCEWSEEFTAPISAERTDRDWDEFSTEPFKAGLLEEIGDDSFAREAYDLFHAHDFVGLWKHCKQNNSNMLPENAAKFLELSALAAPIINIEESDRPLAGEIVNFVGKEKYNSSYTYIPQFPRFSYEMFFCVMVDIDCGAKPHNELLSHLFEYICGDISDNSVWSLVEKERALLRVVGVREDDDVGGTDCISDFGRMWLSDEDLGDSVE